MPRPIQAHPPRRRQPPHHGRRRRQDRDLARSQRRGHRQTTAGGGARARAHRPSHEERPGVRHRHRRGRHGREAHARDHSVLPSAGARTLHAWTSPAARAAASASSAASPCTTRPAWRWKRSWAPPPPRSRSTTCARRCRTTSRSARVRLLTKTGGKRDFQRATRKEEIMNAPRLHGLVLAGGRSTRMRRDKAAIEFRSGETQLDAAMKLLEGRVARAFVSVRADQRDDPARSRHRAHRRSRRRRRPDRRHQRGVRQLPGRGLAGAGLRPAVPRRAHARHAAARARPELRRHGLPFQPRWPARAAVRHLRAARARRRSHAHIAAGRNCPRKFLINAHTRCSISRIRARSTT